MFFASCLESSRCKAGRRVISQNRSPLWAHIIDVFSDVRSSTHLLRPTTSVSTHRQQWFRSGGHRPATDTHAPTISAAGRRLAQKSAGDFAVLRSFSKRRILKSAKHFGIAFMEILAVCFRDLTPPTCGLRWVGLDTSRSGHRNLFRHLLSAPRRLKLRRRAQFCVTRVHARKTQSQ